MCAVPTLRRPLVLLVCLGVWLHAADALVATTVMPSAIAEIGGLAFLYWTITLYELGSIVASAATGLLARRLGLRAAMCAAAGLYVLGCATSALAGTIGGMLVGRLVQGLGGGAMLALSYVGVSQLFPEPLWPRVLAIVAGVWGVSALFGPLVGGAFASAGLWRGAFWAFAVQGLVLIVTTPLLVPAAPTATASEATALPSRQLLALSVGVLAISAAGVQPDVASMATYVIVGLAALGLVLRLEKRAPARLFPRAPLDLDVPWGAGYAMVLALAAATVSFTVYGPLLLAQLFGVIPLGAGLLVAVESVSWTLAAIATSGAPPDRESLLIRAGATVITLGVAGLAWTMPHGPVWALVPWTVLQGAGFGMCWAFVLRRIVTAVPADDSERASAALPTMQMIGYAIGAAASGMVANALGLRDGAAPEVVRTVAFWVFAAFLPLAAFGVTAAWRLAGTPMESPAPIGSR
jgi:MFS family permease